MHLSRIINRRTDEGAPFTDVTASSAFSTEITWMSQAGLSQGIRQTDGTVKYGPKDQLSREAMAAFMYRLGHK